MMRSINYALAGGFLSALGVAAFLKAIPIQIPFFYFLMSFAAFVTYILDKRAARRGSWRTSEKTLHLWALFGGWPGALIAQSRFRHKTRKHPFQIIFWLTVVLNCAALAWLLTTERTGDWQSLLSSVS